MESHDTSGLTGRIRDLARERDAVILAELLGYGACADAYRVTDGREDGAGGTPPMDAPDLPAAPGTEPLLRGFLSFGLFDQAYELLTRRPDGAADGRRTLILPAEPTPEGVPRSCCGRPHWEPCGATRRRSPAVCSHRTARGPPPRSTVAPGSRSPGAGPGGVERNTAGGCWEGRCATTAPSGWTWRISTTRPA